MTSHTPSVLRALRRITLLTIGTLALMVPTLPRVVADPPKSAAKKEAAASQPTAVITPEMWRKASTAPLEPGEIDRLVSAELARNKVPTAPRTNDEQFLRRVYLDLTGALPAPADIEAFGKSTDPNRRAKVIDRLLETPAYARHWARYWREVIEARVTDQFSRITAGQF
jgi:hypothetical protein